MLGLTRSQVRTLRERRSLRPEAPRVFASRGAPDSIDRSTMRRAPLPRPDGGGEPRGRSPPPSVRPIDPRCRRVRDARDPDAARARPVPRPHQHRVCRPSIGCTMDGFPARRPRRTIIDLARARIARSASKRRSTRRCGLAPAPLSSSLAASMSSAAQVGGAHPVSTGCCSTAAGTRCSSGASSSSCARRGFRRPHTQVVHRHGTRTFARVDFLSPTTVSWSRSPGARATPPTPSERGRTTPQRAAGHRPQGLRVHVAAMSPSDPGYVRASLGRWLGQRSAARPTAKSVTKAVSSRRGACDGPS